MKSRRRMAFLIMVIIFVMSVISSVPVYATETNDNKFDQAKDESVISRSNNVDFTATIFKIYNGSAELSASYTGYSGYTTGATITIKLQKKFLFWWFDVDNGQPDNTWTDVFVGWRGTARHSLPLSGTGEYRAIITYTIRGTYGSDDVIPITMYDNYE